MSDEAEFGDFVNDDAFDREPPDPEQVARKFHQYRRQHDTTREWESWEQLNDAERTLLLIIFTLIIRWLRRQGGIQ